MPMLTTWYFILPGALSVLYCFTQYRSFSALGFSSRTAKIICLTPTVAECVLVMLWAALGYPLPVAYLLAYLCRAVRLLGMGHIQMKNWFVLNLSYVNTIALHLSFIGGLALFQNVTMHTLLQSPFWRAASLSVVLASSVIEDTLFLRWPNFSTLLSAEAESAEARRVPGGGGCTRVWAGARPPAARVTPRRAVESARYCLSQQIQGGDQRQCLAELLARQVGLCG